MISEYFHPLSKGGGELSAYMLAKQLAASDIEMHVLTSRLQSLKSDETIEGIRIHRYLRTGDDPASLTGNIKRVLSFEKSILAKEDFISGFDLIHCMNTTSISAVKLKRKIKSPFVLHVNGPTLFCPKATLMYKDREICNKECTTNEFLGCWLGSSSLGKIEMGPLTKINPFIMMYSRRRYLAYKRFLGAFDFYMPISSFMQDRLEFAGIDKKKTEIIYNVIRLEDYLNLGQPKNKTKKILYLGEYSRPKGVLVLLEALKQLDGYEASFYGSGVLKEKLIKTTMENRMNIKVHDSVAQSEIPKIMQQHDIVVFPSLVGEAFGRVALEACAAGKTVIASDIGGTTDIIIQGRTGFLFPAGDSSALSRILKDVISGEKSIDTQEARKLIKERFSKKEILLKVIRSYRKLKRW